MKLCSRCKTDKPKEEFGPCKRAKLGLKSECRSCATIANRESIFRLTGRVVQDRPPARWSPKHPEVLIETRKAWQKERRADPRHRLIMALRQAAHRAYTPSGQIKNTRTEALLGASFDFVSDYLINSALKRYGFWLTTETYEVDHIIPISTARTDEDILRLGHYTNLQLLTAKDNRSKAARLDWL